MSEDQREFARIPVTIHAGVRPLETPEDEEELRNTLRLRASVWAPSNEIALRDLITSANGTTESFLAQAIMDLTDQIVLLRSKLLDPHGNLYPVDLIQLSGGGGQFDTRLPVNQDDKLEIRFQDEESEMPPIRALIEVVHKNHQTGACGFRFDTIHAKDQERLIRMIYQLQRRALRATQLQS